MKIAIVGAGIAGLSCAHELIKNGIIPTIFDNKDYIGQDINYGLCTLNLYEMLSRNPMDYFNKTHNLHINPINSLNEIIMISPNKETVIKGNLGYIFFKGEQKYSIENQLSYNLNVPINFKSFIDMKIIKNEYDYVIISTGDEKEAKKFGIWTETFSSFVRTAMVSGNFNPTSLKMWLNTKYTKQAYSHLIPINNNKASIGLAVNNIKIDELNYYWDKFITEENINYEIEKVADIEKNMGYLSTNIIDNVLFTGKAGGLVDDCLGFGVMFAIKSGILAAQSIVNKKDYNKLIKNMKDDIKRKHVYRKVLDTFDNDDFDKLNNFLDLPIIKQMIYNNPIAKATYGVPAVKLLNFLSKLR
jgi:digeranylgeranylglycerophospholipid reductase